MEVLRFALAAKMRPAKAKAKAKATTKEASEREKVSLTPTLDYVADLGETAGEDRGALRRLGEAVRREDEGGPDPTSTRPNFDFDPRR